MTLQADIANIQTKRLQEAVKQIRPSKKDLDGCDAGKGQFSGVVTGEDVLNYMKKQENAAMEESKQARRQVVKRADCMHWKHHCGSATITPLLGRLLFAFTITRKIGVYALLPTLVVALTITSLPSQS